MNSNGVRTITNIITVIILTLFFGYLAIKWNSIPDVVAIHFGINGEPDSYGSKGCLIMISGIAVILCAIIAVAEHFPGMWNFPVKVTDENRERLIHYGLIMMGILKILIAAICSYTGICSANGRATSWPVYVLLGAVVIDVIFGIGRMVKCR